MAVEFTGRDVVVRFKEDPDNVAIRQYRIEYQCANRSVIHYLGVDDSQATVDGLRVYKDQLSYAENEAAGLTRQPRVVLYSQNADNQWSQGYTIDGENPLPVLLTAPHIKSTLDGVEVALQMPSDRDLEGFVAWVGSTADFPLDAAHERYRGRASAFSLQLPDDDTYYLRVAPYDAFGLDTFSAWDAQSIKRGDLNLAIGGTQVVQDFQQAQAEIEQAVADAQADANTARNDIADVRADLDAAVIDLNADVSELNADITAAQSEATTARNEAAQVRTDLVPEVNAAKAAAQKASDDLATEVARAQGAEGTINTTLTNLTQTVNGNTTAITTETTQRTNADLALSGRIDTVESTAVTDKGALNTRITNEVATLVSADAAIGQRVDQVITTANNDRSTLNTRITDEATASSTRDATLGNRTSSLESSVTGIKQVIANDYFDNGADGWTHQSQFTAVPVTAGRRNVLRTNPGDKLDSVLGRIVPITSDNQRFRIKAGWRCAVGTAVYYFGVYYIDANGNRLENHTDGTGNYPLGAAVTLDSAVHGWLDRECVIGRGVPGVSEYGGTLGIPAGAVAFRPIFYVNWTSVPGSVTDIDYFAVEDITDAAAANARIATEETTRAGADSALAGRTSTLESTVNSGTDGNAALKSRIATEETTRSNADSTLANRASNLESTVNSGTDGNAALKSRIATEETTRATADSALGSRTTSLEARATNGGNLVPNTAFATTDGWFLNSAPNGASLARNIAGTYYQIGGIENNLAIHQVAGGSGLQAEVLSEKFALEAGAYYQVQALTASHRCKAWVALFIYDANNAFIGYTGENFAERINNGGQNIVAHDITGMKRHQAPPGTAYGRFAFRMYDVSSDGYLWLHRPYVSQVRAETNEWNAYSPGADHLIATSTIARIATEETTRAGADSALSGRVSTTESKLDLNSDSPIYARIRTEETTRANETGGLASRATALESKMDLNTDSNLYARVRNEETTRSTADTALGNRISTTEAQFRGEQDSALKTLINNKRNNLALVDWWKMGAAIPWGINGGQRNEIVQFPHGGNFENLPMPDGSSGDGWLCQADSSGGGAGGWENGQIVPLDPDKTYRFMVPIATLGGGLANGVSRTSYWGTMGVCDLNTANYNGNPYFAIASNMPPNKWHLFVGYLFPRNSTGKTHDGAGVWDMTTGIKIAEGTNFCFHPNGTQPIHRAYQYYASAGAYQGFGRPIVEVVDGSETNIAASLAAAKKATQVDARVTNEETARTNADAAIGVRIGTIDAQMSGGQDSWLAGRIRDEATASANRDTAISNRVSTTEANYNSARTDINNLITDNSNRYNEIVAANSRIGAEETARANADSALANRATSLEASFGANGGLLLNSNFTNGAEGWGLSNCYWVEFPGDMQGAIRSTGNASFQYEHFVAFNPAHSYKMEVRFAARGYGIVQYAGLACYDISKNFLGNLYMPEVGGGSFGWDMYERSTTWSGTDNPASPFYGTGYKIPINCRFVRPLFLMNYQGYGSAGSVVDVDYIRLIDVTENQAAISRISTEETTRATADAALSSRVELMENQWTGTNDSYVFARLRNEETARATADSAIVNRTSSLEASANRGGFLNNNPTFTQSGWTNQYAPPPGWAVWSQDGSGYIGQYTSQSPNNYGGSYPVQIDRSGTNAGIYQGFAGQFPKGWYVLEAELRFEDGYTQGSGLHCNFNNGYANQIDFHGWPDTNEITGDARGNRKFTKLVENPADSGTIHLYMMAGWESFGYSYHGFLRTIWQKAGIRPATKQEIDSGKVSNLSARVTTTESAISTLNGRAASYWQVQSVAGNNRAQITVRSDSNGGAGVDIVGDVNFAGNLNIGPDSGQRVKITNQGVFGYFANGNPAFRLGSW